MLKRIKSKTGKPLCLGNKANVLICKQDLGGWFKCTVFIKNGPTIFTDWFRPENDGLHYKDMSTEQFIQRRDKTIINEVNDILNDYSEGNLIPDLVD